MRLISLAEHIQMETEGERSPAQGGTYVETDSVEFRAPQAGAAAQGAHRSGHGRDAAAASDACVRQAGAGRSIIERDLCEDLGAGSLFEVMGERV